MPIGRIEYHSSVSGLWTTDPPPPAEEDGQRYVGGPNGTAELLYSQIPGSSWTAPRLENAQQWIQANVLDHRIARASLPPDHPYISGGDPGQEWLFWDGDDVVERLVVCDGIVVETRAGVDLPRVTLRRVARPYVFVDGVL